ncbi:MAG: hypothetical protein IKK08_01175 [Clostridia bacterium]|nr:hypothetical protein [Clostridia bacterium]
MRYRITKYDPALRDARGAYLPDEWTSCTDIGRNYTGKKLTAQEYLATENAYIDAIRIIAEHNGCTGFCARQLERLFSVWEVSRTMKRLGLALSREETELYRSVDTARTYTTEEALILARMILRELLWATLCDGQGRLSFTFGYDYYLYADCPTLPDEVIRQIECSGLFVENLGEGETL